ncbi:MAG: hypothetical protein V4487_05835 [Chlamydiota bacterium]
MASSDFFTFYPERISWIGAAAIGAALLMASPVLWMLSESEPPGFEVEVKKKIEKEAAPLLFSLGLNSEKISLGLPELRDEMSFSFDLPRPDSERQGDGSSFPRHVLARIKSSGESMRIQLPCRLDLQFKGEKLYFSHKDSSFWMELKESGVDQIESRVFISSKEGKTDGGNFFTTLKQMPILSAQEFPEGSPFRFLAEVRWWGHDLFREQYEGAIPPERLEMGSLAGTVDIVELMLGDWLVWNEGRWQKAASLQEGKNKPIARILAGSGNTLNLEGWDQDRHMRFALNLAASPPFKIRAEDLFSSVRIRSEKQISCMLEKQCLILKAGDWVLKTEGRWKILRRKEQREAFLKGKVFGDLFVFEQINLKQGQKMIQGRFFNPGRSQIASIEIPAQSTRKHAPGNGALRKGKAR